MLKFGILSMSDPENVPRSPIAKPVIKIMFLYYIHSNWIKKAKPALGIMHTSIFCLNFGSLYPTVTFDKPCTTKS